MLQIRAKASVLATYITIGNREKLSISLQSSVVSQKRNCMCHRARFSYTLYLDDKESIAYELSADCAAYREAPTARAS